jgi:hypothetical protein
MTKLILQAGQTLDVVHFGNAQFFCVVDGQTPLATTIYHDNDILTNVTIQRLIVDSTMIVSIETDTALTDENGNFYECVKFASILTENNFKPFL